MGLGLGLERGGGHLVAEDVLELMGHRVAAVEAEVVSMHVHDDEEEIELGEHLVK